MFKSVLEFKKFIAKIINHNSRKNHIKPNLNDYQCDVFCFFFLRINQPDDIFNFLIPKNILRYIAIVNDLYFICVYLRK